MCRGRLLERRPDHCRNPATVTRLLAALRAPCQLSSLLPADPRRRQRERAGLYGRFDDGRAGDSGGADAPAGILPILADKAGRSGGNRQPISIGFSFGFSFDLT